MPEGDTLARAAESLRAWLEGRTITGVDARDVGLRAKAATLVGRTVDAVDTRGKHLLITVGDRTVHSHMRMTGSWHVYSAGERWRKRRDAMRLVIETGERVAVCFDAPVVQIVATRDVDLIPGLDSLGPDVLRDFDAASAVARFRAAPQQTTLGDALLDQSLVSGFGNIWRCEALYAERLHPAAPLASVTDDQLRELLATGARMMAASADRIGARPAPQVYKRSGQPCRRCGAAITSQQMGKDNRRAYWCPTCQVR